MNLVDMRKTLDKIQELPLIDIGATANIFDDLACIHFSTEERYYGVDVYIEDGDLVFDCDIYDRNEDGIAIANVKFSDVELMVEYLQAYECGL